MIKDGLFINSEEYPGITLRERQIVLQVVGSRVEILVLIGVEYVVYWFSELSLLYEDRYREIMEQAEVPLIYTPLIISERLYHFVISMPEFLAEENPCSKYIDLKCKELAPSITNFYPLPQLGPFFYPISTYTESFHYFVMQNYSNMKNVEEFAHLGGYTTTTLRRFPKNLYGVPAYGWILEKKREGILEDLQHIKMRIIEVCNRYGFDSLSHFAYFCKDSFGDTLRVLREKTAGGEKIGKVQQTAPSYQCANQLHHTRILAGILTHWCIGPLLKNYLSNSLLNQSISPIFAVRRRRKTSKF